MAKLLVGNAPCSWGTLEFDAAKGEQIRFDRMLDELAETGYTGTELGDWGYMPTDPARLKAELARRSLMMLGAFVPVALKEPMAHAAGIANAVKTARLLAAVAGTPTPYLVLADNNGTVPERTRMAGTRHHRSGPELRTSGEYSPAAPTAWPMRCSRRPACARSSIITAPAMWRRLTRSPRLLALTNPERLGLVFDTGHYSYGAGDCEVTAALERFGERVWYIHCKDCQPEVARQAREEQWDYFTALRHGVFCELGKGCVDFPALLRWLAARHYDGYVLVEQDVLPGMGTPKESARRNREYLRSIEGNFQ